MFFGWICSKNNHNKIKWPGWKAKSKKNRKSFFFLSLLLMFPVVSNAELLPQNINMTHCAHWALHKLFTLRLLPLKSVLFMYFLVFPAYNTVGLFLFGASWQAGWQAWCHSPVMSPFRDACNQAKKHETSGKAVSKSEKRENQRSREQTQSRDTRPQCLTTVSSALKYFNKTFPWTALEKLHFDTLWSCKVVCAQLVQHQNNSICH